MGHIRVVEPETVPWMVRAEEGSAGGRGLVEATDDKTQAARIYHPEHDEGLQVFEVRMMPGEVIEPHAHESDEIIFVLEGELVLGSRTLTTGASVSIQGNTLYGFRAGERGLRYLNFRGSADRTFITKDEFMARRAAAQ